MRGYFFLISVFICGLLSAQGELSERQVKLEQQFIEAKREALLGKTEEAIALFRKLLEEEPDSDPVLFELARLEYAGGDAGAAIDALRRGYTLRPDPVYAAFLAELYRSAGRYADGAALYAGLIDRNPAEAENYLERAAFQVREQDIKGAIKTYDRLQERTGINAELTRRKHALYLGTGDTRRAERELTDLIGAFPRQLPYRHLLAAFYTSQGEAKDARRVYEEILEIEPADVKAQLALQDAAPRTAGGEGDDSVLLALMSRSDVELDLKIGKLLPRVQQVATARDAALADRTLLLTAELRRVHPDEAKVTAIEGDLYYHTGRLTEAAEAFRTTLTLDDTVYPVWEQLLATLYLNNETADLRKYGEEALDVFPNRPSVYVHYAMGEALRGDYEEAGSLLQQAQLMVSGSPEGTAALAEMVAAVALLDAAPAPVTINTKLLPGGEAGPLAFYLTQRAAPDAAALLAADGPANTNALLLELMGDARRTAGDDAAAAALYTRAKAAGSKSVSLAGKLAAVN